MKWWLSDMESAWEILTKLEETALSSDTCAAFMRTMSWPMHQFCREVCIERFGVQGRALQGNV